MKMLPYQQLNNDAIVSTLEEKDAETIPPYARNWHLLLSLEAQAKKALHRA